MKKTLVLIFAFVLIGFASSICFAKGQQETTKGEKLSVGVIMWGFHDEGVWDTNAWESLERLAEKYPIEIGYSEEIDMKEIELAVKARAEMNDIVLAHSMSFEEAVRKIAPSYPDTVFLTEQFVDKGPDYYPPNVVTIGQNDKESIFLIGALAAKMSKSKKLGVIQALDDSRDTLIATGFRGGAQYVDSTIQVSRVIMNAYIDPVKARDSVKAFVEKGVDVVFVSQDDMSGTLEAKAQGIFSVQQYKDETDKAPDTILNCSTRNLDVALEMILKSLMDGSFETFRSKNWFIPSTLKDGTCGIGAYGNMVPEDVKNYIEGLTQKIINGELKVEPKVDW